MIKPRLSSVLKHFKNAKVIRCLKTGIEVDITFHEKFEWNEKERVWSSPGGTLVFWKNGEFAEIIKKKCNCKNCNCNK